MKKLLLLFVLFFLKIEIVFAQAMLVQSVSGSNSTNASLSIPWSFPTKAGNFLVAVVCSGRGNLGGAPTITPPAGWSVAVTDTSIGTLSGEYKRGSIYYKENAPSESGSKTWSSSTYLGSGRISVIMVEYYGVAQSACLDKSASATSSLLGLSANSGTTQMTAQNRELVIAAMCGHTDDVYVMPTNGFVIKVQVSLGLGVAILDRNVNVTGTFGTGVSANLTLDNYVGTVVSFKVDYDAMRNKLLIMGTGG